MSGTHPPGHSPAEHHGAHGAGSEPGKDDKPDIHGMFVCGEEAVFFCHLPMFGHRHHDFQVVLEVELPDKARAEYLEDRRKTGQTLYTFRPEPFRLPDLASSGAVQEIEGSIFHGHFEKGGMPLEHAPVRIATIVHFRQFDPKASPLEQLKYILFGRDGELFLAHLITRPPDFDQVVPVEISGGELTDEELRRGPVVAFPGRPNTLEQRLKAGEQVEGDLASEANGGSRKIMVKAGPELYFEEGELSSPASFDQTEAEASAGFE